MIYQLRELNYNKRILKESEDKQEVWKAYKIFSMVAKKNGIVYCFKELYIK